MKFINRKRSSPKIEVYFSEIRRRLKHLKGCVCGHVLSVQNAEKENIWTFFNVLGGQNIFHQKGGQVLQKENVW